MDHLATKTRIKDLDNGFILRHATLDDVGALVEFNHKIHDDGNWTKSLLSGTHPTTSIDDFVLVEEMKTGKIVSTMGMIPQVWSYGSVEIRVARPDLVGTDPDYRNRGFVREQFDALHRMSQERGHLMEVLVGRPWFYRKFGYTMALPYGGGWEAELSELPALKEGDEEPLIIRPADREDIPFIRELYDRWRISQPISCVRDERLWAYEMLERDVEEKRVAHRIIEDRTGDRVGYFVHGALAFGPVPSLFDAQLVPTQSWVKAAPTIMRYLKRLGDEYVQSHPEYAGKPLVADILERLSPLIRSLPNELFRRPYKPLAWYIHISDLVAFIKHIVPALERRLAGSTAAGHTGELAISFWRGGLKLRLEKGSIVSVEDWPLPEQRGDANLPIENFIQLVFGQRSIAELVDLYNPEVTVKKDGELLLSALFPKQASAVYSIY
ncbi:MAG: GNAT family N-acetyltransferase [Bacillota bacterium]